MRKFYAPTGAFRSGPIVPTELNPPPPSSEASRESSTAHETQQNQGAQADTVETVQSSPPSSPPEERRDESSATDQSSVMKAPEKAVTTSLPSSQTSASRTFKTAAAAIHSEPQAFPQPKAVAKAPPLSPSQNSTPYEAFARKWKMYLYPGQLAVMRILYEMTFAVGTTECFTRYSELARATKMSRRNCINVVNSLANRGFIERLEVRNDASAKGIRLRVHLEPTS